MQFAYEEKIMDKKNKTSCWHLEEKQIGKNNVRCGTSISQIVEERFVKIIDINNMQVCIISIK